MRPFTYSFPLLLALALASLSIPFAAILALIGLLPAHWVLAPLALSLGADLVLGILWARGIFQPALAAACNLDEDFDALQLPSTDFS